MLQRSAAILRCVPCRIASSRRWHRQRAGREPEYAPSEKLISVSDVVREAAEMGEDFVFTDNSDEPVFAFEEALKGDPEERTKEMPKIKNKLDVEALDVTSAYAPEQGSDVHSVYGSAIWGCGAGFKQITADALKERLQEKAFALLLDVRGPDEFASGHVTGARNAPLSELNAEYIAATDLKDYKEKPVAVICGVGKRSAQATVRLTKVLGFTDVTSVAEGTKGWIERGYEIEK